MNGDGCSSSCEIEPGFMCLLQGTMSVCNCTPNAFIGCGGQNAVYCDSTGKHSTNFDCSFGGGCITTPGLTGCGQCAASTCNSGSPSTYATCDTAHDAITAETDCYTLGPSASSQCQGQMCAKCTGSAVCGDGVHYGTQIATSYGCSNGFIGPATTCTQGCDNSSGLCGDLVPANQAAAHLAPGDKFTCTGTQSTTLEGVDDTVFHGYVTVTIDTGAKTIIDEQGFPHTALWGAPFVPAGSHTTTIVAHLSYFYVQGVVTTNVVVTGPYALILLIDHVFSFEGPGRITVSTGSPNTSTTAGAPASMVSFGGGGGAGYVVNGSAGGMGDGSMSAGAMGGGADSVLPSLEPLEAGQNGGSGSGGALGGQAGGALQITACGGIQLTNGTVIADGGGGKGGAAATVGGQPGDGGGGGGSGGTILLEAPTVGAAQIIVADGGAGGGGGATYGGAAGGDGIGWSASFPSNPPQGGAGGGKGGSGGNLTVPSGTIGANGPALFGGGGGGGAVGAIYVNLRQGAAAPSIPATPAIRYSTLCITQNGTAPACNYP